MNKLVKFSLLAVGFILVIYGIYTLIIPETSVGAKNVNEELIDKNDAYITIVLGFVAIMLSFVAGKTYK